MKCATCVFMREGQCHRFPPTPVTVLEKNAYDQWYSYTSSERPTVGPNESCGEYREKREER